MTDAEKVEPIWQFGPVADYSLPVAPVSQAARRRLAFLRRLWQRNNQESEPLFSADDDLLALSAWWLARIVPTPDWEAAAQALHATLSDWLARQGSEQPIVLLVAPPHSGVVKILRAWADREEWPVLTGPTPGQIFDDADDWSPQRPEEAGGWVLPHMERLYLRHQNGLGLVRRFLNRAIVGEWGRGVLCCDSWAWAYLRHVWQGRQPITLSLQAFGRERLTALFQEMGEGFQGDPPLFRQADNGRYILPPPAEEGKSAELSTFLQILAAHSRGIPGVARSIWRSSLQTEPDDSIDEETAQEDRRLPNRTIWVKPWNSITHPAVRPGAGREQAFVLHTLLLHNGLPLELLQGLLPLSPTETAATVSSLADAGLIGLDEQRLRVTPAGYPDVRQFLQREGYLVDQF